MKRYGFTLLEVMITVTVLTLVVGAIFALSSALAQSTQIQESKVTTSDDVRTAMLFLERELRQASIGSINWASLPADRISYRAATDIDGNGTAVDASGFLELGPVCTISRDMTDLNGDGLTVTQLIWTDGTSARVIANGLAPNEDVNNNGVLDPGEDRNANGRLERGIWFAPANPGLQITVDTQRATNARRLQVVSHLVEVIIPRN
ncbi:MAG TPA: prepilin-type N-terminal cleavage/methylation domain-containing protein [Candidatus Hydrogenedentes bacterium]|nr:prepilin-type N-terminal cleavage/methylation domain-containing protein [Candidatus Hydrogenedentota bacterium]HOL77908.1 prepilin-type N-terminal cleavage/methylation domain-containing protein [Candidatus Hydrogenedentota bacterium]HPO87122.1 prepilin-type N-terminal cleavage/methylation domain-containing protein [Candidatus Hydrogenedentota bacterium]